ncbi:GspH/FimT family pseudopilin [Acinetobacter pragensis]|uniref:Type II secretion system protein H n=1 Tax=Acinetobacter pragensis TaxID=1806892 RepID=A0A151Y1F4_9GAMM|nr:GspH/FimT family pseudopilin [Acinetobacter pragensis]KYQ71882.1 hypothetical protein AZH43_13090 [Acinetobacter pragensis]
MQRNNGFTLIELMVTIAVIAIVAMIAAPNMSEAIAKRQIERTTTDFEKALTQARSDAVLSRKQITIHLGTSGKDTPTERYWSIPDDVDLSFNEGVCTGGSWSTSAITALTDIVFLPQGNVSALPTNLEVKLTRDQVDRFIYLTSFGRVASNAKSAFEGSCT